MRIKYLRIAWYRRLLDSWSASSANESIVTAGTTVIVDFLSLENYRIRRQRRSGQKFKSSGVQPEKDGTELAKS